MSRWLVAQCIALEHVHPQLTCCYVSSTRAPAVSEFATENQPDRHDHQQDEENNEPRHDSYLHLRSRQRFCQRVCFALGLLRAQRHQISLSATTTVDPTPVSKVLTLSVLSSLMDRSSAATLAAWAVLKLFMCSETDCLSASTSASMDRNAAVCAHRCTSTHTQSDDHATCDGGERPAHNPACARQGIHTFSEFSFCTAVN